MKQTTTVMGDRIERGCPYDEHCEHWPKCLVNFDLGDGECPADELDRIGETENENN